MLGIKNKDSNYLAKVVRLEDYLQHPNADRLLIWRVDGMDVITDNINYQKGDICIYFPLETKINTNILSKLNVFEDKTLNQDPNVKGYIHKSGRIRAVKLREVLSEGWLVKADVFFECFDITVADRMLEAIIDDEFDTIDDTLVCEKYVPIIKEPRNSGTGPKTKRPKLKDWLYEDQFKFHNNTTPFKKNLSNFWPDDVISITNKWHGTSVVLANVVTKRKLGWKDKLARWLGVKIVNVEYSKMYSSRRVLKGIENKWSNDLPNYYDGNIHGKVFRDNKDKLEKGITLYGEIVGFTNSGKAIQKNYDYGCTQEEGNFYKFVVYKITYTNVDGFTITLGWQQTKLYCEANDLKFVPEIFFGKATHYHPYTYEIGNYEGILKWRQEFVDKLSNEFLEDDCKYCNNKVPAEGIVITIDQTGQAFKLKSKRFLLEETKTLDDIKEEDYVE